MERVGSCSSIWLGSELIHCLKEKSKGFLRALSMPLMLFDRQVLFLKIFVLFAIRFLTNRCYKLRKPGHLPDRSLVLTYLYQFGRKLLWKGYISLPLCSRVIKIFDMNSFQIWPVREESQRVGEPLQLLWWEDRRCGEGGDDGQKDHDGRLWEVRGNLREGQQEGKGIGKVSTVERTLLTPLAAF